MITCSRCITQKNSTHRVVCLVDAEQEDELGEKERRHQVPVDGVEVGAEPAQEAQQDEGEEEKGEGDGHRGVGDDLQWENVAVLRGGGAIQTLSQEGNFQFQVSLDGCFK